jgi:N6-adenosine-specific RNA methylase IME4
MREMQTDTPQAPGSPQFVRGNLTTEVILADPPWEWRAYSKKGQGRSAAAYYDTMSLDQIKRVPIGDWKAKNALLFLWELNSMPIRLSRPGASSIAPLVLQR